MPQELRLGTIFTGRVDAKFRKAIADLDRSLVALNTLMGKTTKATASASAASTKVAGAQARAAAGAKKHTKALHPLNKQIAKVHGAVERFKAALKVTAAYGLAAAGIFAITNALKAGVLEIVNFDQALRNLEAITRALPEEVAIMSSRMIEVAKTTKFSTTEIAEGMVLLGQAGFSAAEGINAIQAVANLASGTLTDMKSTADLVTSALRAFQLDSIEASRVSDVFANAINKSKLTMDKIRTSFNYVGAAAYQVGLSIEETAATMMLLANNGLRASTIGTGFRQVLSRMIAPSRKLKEAFKDYGIEIDSINPKLMGYQVAMENLAKVITKADGITIDMTKAFGLFGLRGAQAAAVISDGFLSNKFKNALKKVHEVGAAEEMAAIQAKGLWFQFKNLSDRAGALALAFGDAGVKGMLQALVLTLRTMVILITKLVEGPISQIIIKFGLWTVATLVLSRALQALHAILSVHILQSLGKLFVFLFAKHPWTFAVIGVTALVQALQYFDERMAKNIERLKQNIVLLSGNIHSLGAYKAALQTTFDEMKEGAELSDRHLSILERLKKAHPELAELIDSTTKSWEGYKKILEGVNKEHADQERYRIGAVIGLAGEQQAVISAAQTKIDALERRGRAIFLRRARGEIAPPGEEDPVVLAKMIEAAEKDLSKAEDARAKSIEKLTALIYGRAQAEENSVEAGYRWLTRLMRLGKFTDEEVARIKFGLIPALEKLVEARKKATDAEGEVVSTKLAKKRLRFLEKYYGLLSSMEGDRLTRLKWQFDQREMRIDRAMNEELETITEGEEEKEAIRKKYRFLHTANERFLLKKKLDIQADLAKRTLINTTLMEKNRLELEKRGAIIRGESMVAFKEKERELEINSLREQAALAFVYYDQKKRHYNKGDKELENARKVHLSAMLALNKALTDDEIADNVKLHRDKVKNLKSALKLEKKYTMEWLAIKKQLLDAETISQTEYDEAVRQSLVRQATWWERLKFGIEEARTKGKDFKDTWVEVGEGITATIADSMTSSLLDFAKGTKNAKEAFKDFAESTIDWLFKMIVRQTIYNSLIGAITSWSTPAPSQPTPVVYAHKGGVIGKDVLPKRYHGGDIVRQNEVPAILEKGEGVFTKNQMKAMGGPQSISVNIINKSNTDLRATSAQPRFDMGKMILDVVLEGTVRNKGGFRDNMKGAYR